MIVLDASAAVELLLSTPSGLRVGHRIAGGESLHAPHVIDLEVIQVLRRYTALALLASSEAEAALEDLRALGIQRYPHDVLTPRIWRLRANATAYDAAYLALAEGLSATVLTCDAKLARTPGTTAAVEVV